MIKTSPQLLRDMVLLAIDHIEASIEFPNYQGCQLKFLSSLKVTKKVPKFSPNKKKILKILEENNLSLVTF